jgi:hypothetical protein
MRRPVVVALLALLLASGVAAASPLVDALLGVVEGRTVVSTIATYDGRPDPAQPLHQRWGHRCTETELSFLACPRDLTPESVSGPPRPVANTPSRGPSSAQVRFIVASRGH